MTLVLPEDLRGLYYDEDTGRRISTHSMLKTFRRCPKQAEFKYVHRLKPKVLGTPLKRGTWIHTLLEYYHSGRDWREQHQRLCTQFNQLFDEEKDYYGDLPTEILALMEAYVWHYKADPWIVHETEFQVEAELPDGSLYRGKVDALVENPFGLWVVDHKSHRTLPDLQFRLLDAQSALYLWACRQSGIPVLGFIWNYIRWKAPSVPAIIKDGSRLSKVTSDTDFPTYVRALQQYKEEYPNFKILPEHRARAKALKDQRYEFGKPQTSPFFARHVLEKNDAMLERVVKENTRTSQRMHTYDFSDSDQVERVVDRGCSFSCSYTALCTAELMGGNTRPLIRAGFVTGDPNDYYQDRAGDNAEREER